MKLLLDLQGAQGESRTRGVGRYTMSLARGILKNAGDHDVWVGLTSGLPQTLVGIKEALADVLRENRLLIWSSVTPTGDLSHLNDGRLEQAQVVREAFIDAHDFDVVYCSSVIEGAWENSVTTVNRHFPGPLTAATLYDLIPIVDARYMKDENRHRWYRRRLAELRRADLLLAISESSQREGREVLGLPEDRLVNIRTAADDIFVPQELSPDAAAQLRQTYGIVRPFVMYSGGVDPRKNVDGLIAAFARLPASLRETHQLVLVGSEHPEINPRLKEQARSLGLADDTVVFTGFVQDDDIVAMYNLSTAFVFPSQHEGFGLPPLEAMSCGVPTIAANNSSLPEVIGNDDALFDTNDTGAMAAMMERVLSDDAFRRDLGRRGLEHAKTFSWDDSARRALKAFEDLAASAAPRQTPTQPQPYRPWLAFVSPIPQKGTAARSRFVHLVEELDSHYRVDIVTSQDLQTCDFEGPSRLLSTTEFDAQSGLYDRVVLHFANDPSYGFVRNVQALHPGTVLLDHFYLDRALPSGLDVHSPDGWAKCVVESEGFDELDRQLRARKDGKTPPRLALNSRVLETANGVIVTDPVILDLARDSVGAEAVADWSVVPLLAPGGLMDRADPSSRSTLAAFGKESGRMHHHLVAAWLTSTVSADPDAELVIVGPSPAEPYGQLLTQLLTDASPAASWRLAREEEAPEIVGRTRVAVDLRTGSDPEARRWLVDCAAQGIRVVAMQADELSPDFTDAALVRALESAWASSPNAVPEAPRPSVESYRDAIERLHIHGRFAKKAHILRVAAQQPALDAADWPKTVLAVNQNHPQPTFKRQLLLDLSTLVRIDSRTGIQRVTRSLAKCLLQSPPSGYRVEPVFCDDDGVIRYARSFGASILGHPGMQVGEDVVVAGPGDVLLGLDLNDRLFPMSAPGSSDTVMGPALVQLVAQGVECHIVVYDLLPARHPEWFAWPEHWFPNYLAMIARHSSGLICISQSTADDMADWMREHVPDTVGLPIDWWHLGADIESSVPSDHVTPDFEDRWERRGPGPSVLMVGTVEPRKGHDQAVAAFSELWRRGVDANLVIVGHMGWGLSTLVDTMRTHPEWGRRMLWFEGASDAELLELYRRTDGCLMASRGEGFGLPLIEAARYDVPVLARDLGVFKEIGGDHVTYFSGESPTDLADSMERWFAALSTGTAPRSGTLEWLTWDESTHQFLAALERNLSG